MKLENLAAREIRRRLRSDGLALDFGLARVRVISHHPDLPDMLRTVYGGFPDLPAAGFFDVTVRLEAPSLLRRRIRPTVEFQVETAVPFPAYPADTPLPLLEWGINYTISDRRHDHVLYHAGAVAKDDRAILMPALPGAGKSTLTAAFMFRGYRLLSDEFGAWHLTRRSLTPCTRPIALKNESIDVLRAFAPDAMLGPTFPRTPKGAVAHVAPTAASIAGRHRSAAARMIVFPRFARSAAIELVRLDQAESFARLSGNSFNYELLGATAFRETVHLVRTCPSYLLTYGDMDRAIERIDRELDLVCAS